MALFHIILRGLLLTAISAVYALADSIQEPGMIAAAHPAAVEAGLGILAAGGNAIDAAIAVQLALNVVEPPESGIGGGGFLHYRDAKTGKMLVYDGRETAPAAADPNRFTVFGMPVPLWLAVPSGRSVGVPGLVAMLEAAHRAHGQLPWETLFKPAITLADTPQDISPVLQRQIARDYSLRLFPNTRHAFVAPMGEEHPKLHNPALARTLKTLARDGASTFYGGELAEGIVSAAGGRWWWPSDLTIEDLSAYLPEVRDPVCMAYREWTLCGPPPPSSGGITVLQILGLLAHTDWSQYEPESIQAWHLLAEASRLAFADRAYYIGDPEFVDVPTEGLLDATYLARRAALIKTDKAMEKVASGVPEGAVAHAPNGQLLPKQDSTGTTHFSVIDSQGNAVSMTSSIEVPFGSRIMVEGFLLNSQLTDFDFRPRRDHIMVANAVEPGKRPRSSMAPFIVLDNEGDVRMLVGSRGGSRIIGYVVKTLIGVLDWNMTLQEATDLPNLIHTGHVLELEQGTQLSAMAEHFKELGHRVDVKALQSGIHGIEKLDGQWHGAADSRMNGVARKATNPP